MRRPVPYILWAILVHPSLFLKFRALFQKRITITEVKTFIQPYDRLFIIQSCLIDSNQPSAASSARSRVGFNLTRDAHERVFQLCARINLITGKLAYETRQLPLPMAGLKTRRIRCLKKKKERRGQKKQSHPSIRDNWS